MTYPENILVEISVSDPWDWGTIVGCGPFSARIVKWKMAESSHPISVLLELLVPQAYKGNLCKYFVVSPRHAGTSIEDIMRGRELSCNFVYISEDRLYSTDPFDLSWWRGGIALIGTVHGKNSESQTKLSEDVDKEE